MYVCLLGVAFVSLVFVFCFVCFACIFGRGKASHVASCYSCLHENHVHAIVITLALHFLNM